MTFSKKMSPHKSIKKYGYAFMNRAIPIEIIKEIQKYASELLQCRNNKNSIMNAMINLE